MRRTAASIAPWQFSSSRIFTEQLGQKGRRRDPEELLHTGGTNVSWAHYTIRRITIHLAVGESSSCPPPCPGNSRSLSLFFVSLSNFKQERPMYYILPTSNSSVCDLYIYKYSKVSHHFFLPRSINKIKGIASEGENTKKGEAITEQNAVQRQNGFHIGEREI